MRKWRTCEKIDEGKEHRFWKKTTKNFDKTQRNQKEGLEIVMHLKKLYKGREKWNIDCVCCQGLLVAWKIIA